MMQEKTQALLAKVLDLFAQKFDKKAVLRGGMVLRILGSPRLTNDLDYVFVPYKSKKDIVEEIVDCLESIDGARVDYSLNSRCLRVVLSANEATIQVEAKVAMEVMTSTTSTRLFSPLFNLPPRIIHVADHSVALADKMAAWNERRLIRDIYDIWFFLQMRIDPDSETLERRLASPDYSRLVKSKDHFPGTTCSEFYEFLRSHVALLSERDIAAELSDYLSSEDLIGLSMLFRAALVRLR